MEVKRRTRGIIREKKEQREREREEEQRMSEAVHERASTTAHSNKLWRTLAKLVSTAFHLLLGQAREDRARERERERESKGAKREKSNERNTMPAWQLAALDPRTSSLWLPP
jgi:hypothetical protein